MIAHELEILSVGAGAAHAELLPWLAEELRGRFSFRRVFLEELPVDPGWAEPPSSRSDPVGSAPRLSSNRLVDALVDRSHAADVSHTDRWTLAVTPHDLTTPSRDYVFGEATLGGGWAVISTARLGDGGCAGGDLRHRVLAEAVHELGHLGGLDHCDRHGCVMLPSVHPHDIDGKSSDFCTRCAEILPRDRP